MLKYELESIEELDDTQKDLYSEKDGRYILNIEGMPEPEDTSGLKNKLDELMSETKAAKQKARELEAQRQKADEDAAKEKGEFKTLWEQAQQRLQEKDEELAQFNQKIQQRDINIAANTIGQSLAKTDAKRAEVLSDYAQKFAKHNGDKVEFIVGGVAVTEAELMAHLSKEYPFLVDGSNASGGGAQSASGSGASKQMNRADFERLAPAKQMAFVKDGGTIED